MSSSGWALTHYEWCPYKWRRLGHRHADRKGYVKTDGEESRLQAKESGHRMKSTMLTP